MGLVINAMGQDATTPLSDFELCAWSRVIHPRIAQVVEPYLVRWMHHVILEKESDVDDVVRGWLRAAYAFGLKNTKHPKKM